ncbi:MAG: hypothetical protein K0U52_01720 [Gammaproteobacteria bacterium]|nr:hypothetical protein [Gammaproteobacteria bacterium]
MNNLEQKYHIPSRKFLAENVIPRIKAGIESELQASLENVHYFSFTTDAWTTNVSNHSLLSLTAHWVTEDFNRISCVLNVIPLEESHTGTYMCSKLRSSLEKWKIEDSRVHVFLRDNAKNIVKAINDAGIIGQGCLAHTLQLVVQDGVLSQRAVLDVLAVCRRIVGHFKHSATACCAFQKIQQNLGIPQHTLKQDVPTRWNSSYYMLSSIIEQKMALSAYATENTLPVLTTLFFFFFFFF